jgi:hypothetical protein
MSLQRRSGHHPSAFSQEIRDDEHGGTVPRELNLRVIDLDGLYMLVAERAIRVNSAGRIWVWYDDGPVVPLALVEQKEERESQQSWAVTKALALRAGLAGFKVTRFCDGRIACENLGGERTEYQSAKEFVVGAVAPIFAAHREARAA